MNQSELLAQVKKAIDLWMDKTYNESEFYSHIQSIIKEHSSAAEPHIDQMERLIFKVEELRFNQRQYHGGDRTRLGTCKTLESEMDKKIMYLKTVKGYDSDRFKLAKPVQKEFFK